MFSTPHRQSECGTQDDQQAGRNLQQCRFPAARHIETHGIQGDPGRVVDAGIVIFDVTQT